MYDDSLFNLLVSNNIVWCNYKLTDNVFLKGGGHLSRKSLNSHFSRLTIIEKWKFNDLRDTWPT